MSNRTGIYVAFNGCGTTNPTESDIKYFNTFKMWKENKNIDFSFADSHSKTSSVRDTSDKEKTLFPKLQARLKVSKVLLLIVTKNTINSSDVVEFEIEKAIEAYDLPIILVYPDQTVIKSVSSSHKNKLPKLLKTKMEEGKTKTLFIPLKLNAVKKAIADFNVHTENLNNNIYTYDEKDNWD